MFGASATHQRIDLIMSTQRAEFVGITANTLTSQVRIRCAKRGGTLRRFEVAGSPFKQRFENPTAPKLKRPPDKPPDH